MFPYKSFFERHPNLGYSLIIGSIIGIPFCFKYSKWLKTQERMYEAHLHTVNILEFFNLFIEIYKNLGGLDGDEIVYSPVDKEGNYSYVINKIGYTKTFNDDGIYLKYKFEEGRHKEVSESMRKSGVQEALTYIFAMNEREADIVWNRLYTDREQFARRWIKGVHSQQLEAVQFVQPQQDAVPSPDATNEHTL